MTVSDTNMAKHTESGEAIKPPSFSLVTNRVRSRQWVTNENHVIDLGDTGTIMLSGHCIWSKDDGQFEVSFFRTTPTWTVSFKHNCEIQPLVSWCLKCCQFTHQTGLGTDVNKTIRNLSGVTTGSRKECKSYIFTQERKITLHNACRFADSCISFLIQRKGLKLERVQYTMSGALYPLIYFSK